MKQINAYLISRNCREAMTFYQKCLGGDLQVTTFADMPAIFRLKQKTRSPCQIVKGGSPFDASDNMGARRSEHGENFFVAIAV